MRPFASVEECQSRLGSAGYVADDDIATAVFLSQQLGKPLLAEGPAGTGKTELAKAVAAATEAPLIRLQGYEGLDEAKVLYEWDYRKQLLSLQADDQSWDIARQSLFGEEFLLPRPLLAALTADEPVVLLIDEVDRVDIATESLMLEVLSDFQVSIPELGTIAATYRPFVVLTSNDSRDLSDALRRRCLYLHLDYPTVEREAEIIAGKVSAASPSLAQAVAAEVADLRRIEFDKPPSVAESLDWATALVGIGKQNLDHEARQLGVPLLSKTEHDSQLLRDQWRRTT